MTAQAAAISPATQYDVARIRRDFPILGETVHGKPLVYLDNGASAQKPQAVLDAIARGYGGEYANVHRGLHYLSNLSTDRFEAARRTAQRFLNAADEAEIVFTRNATEAINLVAQSFGGARIGAGDEIVLTIMEHHSNIVPWHFHRERSGAVLKWVDVGDDGSFDLDVFERALSPRTKMVAITHMSNVLGTVVPIGEVTALAHARGIPVLVDGSQGAVHLDVDVQDLGVDFYVSTGHKLYGPTGIGLLYGRREHLETMAPYQGGGEMIGTVATDRITYAAPPHRFEAGTPAIVEAIGLAAAMDYMDAVGRPAIRAHEETLRDYAHRRLEAIDGVRIFGTAPGKGAILSFALEGAHAHDVSTVLDRSGVAVRAGTHCAEPLLARFGVTSTCRASFAMYNTTEEIDVLADALEKAKRMFQ
jgi:cysteine desulfurase/selenocysteine lyase